MDHAIQLKRKYNIRSRIVTIDGELISGKGAMSGGRSKEDYSNSLIARRVRLKTLETELKDVEENKGVIENEINNISEEIKQLQGNMDLVREELANISGRSLSSKRVLEELQKSLKEVTDELSDLIKLEAEYTGKYEGNLARIETLDNQSKEYEEKRKVLQVDVSEFSKQLDKHRKKLEELNESIATYRAELKSLSERKLQYSAENDRINVRLDEIAEEIANSKSVTLHLEEEIDSTKKFLLENQRELETLKSTSQDVFAGIRERKSGKEGKLQQLQSMEDDISRQKSDIESMRERIHETDLRLQEIRFKISNIPEEYRTPVDVEPESLDELNQRISDLENKCKMLGPVDLNAMDEYKRVEEEYNELMKQKLDLEDAKKKLEELIEQTDIQAREQFLKTFNQINTSFKGYIENLFYGGTGGMRLIEDNDVLEAGIEITISKAGKRSRDFNYSLVGKGTCWDSTDHGDA